MPSLRGFVTEEQSKQSGSLEFFLKKKRADKPILTQRQSMDRNRMYAPSVDAWGGAITDKSASNDLLKS